MSEELPDWMLGSGVKTDMSGESNSNKYQRFYLKKGTKGNIVFITNGDRAPVIMEHNFKMGSSKTAWMNWLTCLKPMGRPCPLCAFADANDGKFRAYKAAFFGIIDLVEYTGKDGKKYVNQKRILCAKKDSTEMIKRKFLRLLEKDLTLTGAMFEVFRDGSDKSPSIGNEYNYEGHRELASFPDHTDWNWAEVLKPNPKRMEEVVAALRMGRDAPLAGSSDSGDYGHGSEGTDARIDF